MGRTKKVGSAGRYGSRYGKKIRQGVVAAELTGKADYTCPSCLKNTLKRARAGIWECRKCGTKMAGKAFKPS